MTESIIDRLAAKSKVGQDSFNGPKIPTIKFDGSGAGDTAGHFLRFNDEKMEDLGNSLSLQIIRVRKKLLQGGELVKYFSDEYDSPSKDRITLKMSSRSTDKEPWGKPTIVSEGTASDIRMTNDVKVVSVVYAILGDELVKMTVKGASTTESTGLFEYLDGFKSNHVFQYITEITSSKVQKNRAISYHRMHFKRGVEITEGFELVEQYLDIVEGVAPKVASTPVATAPATPVGNDGEDDFF